MRSLISRVNRPHINLVLIAGLLLLAVSPQASAFEQWVHKAITTDALETIPGFNLGGIVEIRYWNMLTDFSPTVDESAYHFSECCWERPTAVFMPLCREKAAYYANAYLEWQGIDPELKEDGFMWLGRVFHICQDFFAHSNWVENTAICADLPDLRSGQRPSWWYSADGWKNPECCLSGEPSHVSLNKDSPDRPGYSKAYCHAVLESRHQWEVFETYVLTHYPAGRAEEIIDLFHGYDPYKVPDGPSPDPVDP
jgi:hypothetical protein